MSDQPEMNDAIRRELERRQLAKRDRLFPPVEPDPDTTDTDTEEQEHDD